MNSKLGPAESILIMYVVIFMPENIRDNIARGLGV
jgi:hypothetical protein